MLTALHSRSWAIFKTPCSFKQQQKHTSPTTQPHWSAVWRLADGHKKAMCDVFRPDGQILHGCSVVGCDSCPACLSRLSSTGTTTAISCYDTVYVIEHRQIIKLVKECLLLSLSSVLSVHAGHLGFRVDCRRKPCLALGASFLSKPVWWVSTHTSARCQIKFLCTLHWSVRSPRVLDSLNAKPALTLQHCNTIIWETQIATWICAAQWNCTYILKSRRFRGCGRQNTSEFSCATWTCSVLHLHPIEEG
jgi:hypothetical protein